MGTPNNNRLPDEVYVRRRVAAVVVLLVVIALIVWGLVSMSGGNEEETEPAAETTSQAAETTPEETETTEAEETSETSGTSETSETDETSGTSETSESEDPTESTAASGTEAAQQSCELSDLQVSVSSDQPNYSAGTEPTFYLSVENPTAADCEIDLSEDTMRFEVYSLATNERIWSDVDCNAPVGDGEETFEADTERNFQAVWSRTTSSPDNCSAREPVPAGSYFLHGVIGSNASNSLPFNLG